VIPKRLREAMSMASSGVWDRPLRCAQAALLSLFICVTLFSATLAWALPIVSDARVSQHDALTRIAISVSTSVPYQIFTLSNPDRIVIDLPEVQWGVPPNALEFPQSGPLERVRHGHFKPGLSRIVIDCRRPVALRYAALIAAGTSGYRFIIDLAKGEIPHGMNPESAPIGDVTTPPPSRPTGFADSTSVAPQSVTTGDTSFGFGDRVHAARTLSELGEPATSGQPLLVPAALVLSTPRPRPLLVPTPQEARWVIALDPGHGGQDPGAVGLSGVYEKHITLATARAVRDELNALGRYKVILTRNKDVFLRLRDRIAVARAAGADLFLSLHADKMENHAVRGLSVYTLSERASDAEAAALAEQENKVDLINGVKLKGETPEVTNILIDLAQRETMNESARLASSLVRELQHDTTLLPKTHRFAGFAVLKAPDVPSALIELGYLSNPADEKLLRDAEHRRRLAKAVARAVDGYFVRVEARNRH
jgi:N-acetylmuramoyl-L-alanine amidase